MRLTTCALTTLSAIWLAASTPALAQAPTSDPGAAQIVGLFNHGCLVFAGNAAGMRAWIAAHRLPPVPSSEAPSFIGGLPGEAFAASNAVGKYALVSYDNGSCQAIAMTGKADDVERLLLAALRQQGITVTPLEQKSAPEHGAVQKIFMATLGERRWTLSLTTHTHVDAPNLAPELHLLATPG